MLVFKCSARNNCNKILEITQIKGLSLVQWILEHFHPYIIKMVFKTKHACYCNAGLRFWNHILFKSTIIKHTICSSHTHTHTLREIEFRTSPCPNYIYFNQSCYSSIMPTINLIWHHLWQRRGYHASQSTSRPVVNLTLWHHQYSNNPEAAI